MLLSYPVVLFWLCAEQSTFQGKTGLTGWMCQGGYPTEGAQHHGARGTPSLQTLCQAVHCQELWVSCIRVCHKP